MAFAADAGSAFSIASAAIAALVAILGVMGYQSRRARLSAIRAAFNDVVAALAAAEPRRQLAAAILLRRFFDPGSELGVRDLLGRCRAPYAGEALSVIAAVLRGLPSGDLQKLLADGLAYAPSLAGADLQRTNLQGAYLTLRHAQGTLERADFYGADLSGGSLKGARARGAVFYQARLQGTVLRNADLRGANFFEADLTGANFTGARLDGASFVAARGLPRELERAVDAEGRYMGTAPVPAPESAGTGSPSVFLSLPASRTPGQEAMRDRLVMLLRHEGLAVQQLLRDDYPDADALGEIHRRMRDCAGAVVLGLRDDGRASSETTPWTHLEAGMAYGCNLPLLIAREPGVRSGAFDDVVAGRGTFVVDVASDEPDEALVSAMRPWLLEVIRS